MDILKILFVTVMLSCVCDGTYFFKPKKIFLPPIEKHHHHHHHHHIHPHPHPPHPHPPKHPPHSHFPHNHHHPHGMEDHGFFHKFHKPKFIHHRIRPLPKPVMYKTFLIRKYSLPPDFHVHISLNKKIYGHSHGPFKPHTHYPKNPTLMMHQSKMKKIYRPKQFPHKYGQYPVKNILTYGTRGKVPRFPESGMQIQTNMFLPTGILHPPTTRPSKKPRISKYELWLRKINDWMIRKQNTAKGIPVKIKRKRIFNKIHTNIPNPPQRLNIPEPRPRKKDDGIIANFVFVKPPFISKSEDPVGQGIPVSEKPKPSTTNKKRITPKPETVKLRPKAPVMGIPISLDNIGPPFDITEVNDLPTGGLPPPIEIIHEPIPGSTGGVNKVDVGLPIGLTPGPFGSDSVTPPSIIVDGLPTEQNVNSIVPLPGNINEMLTDVADLSEFPNLDLSNEPLIIEPFGPMPPDSQSPLPLDIQPFPWDPSQIPFPPEVIPRISNKEKEPYVMRPLEPIVKIIGRDSIKRKNDTIFVPKPISDPKYNETEQVNESPYSVFTEGPVEPSTQTTKTTMPATAVFTTQKPSVTYQTTTMTLPPLSIMELRDFEHPTSATDVTTQTTTTELETTSTTMTTNSIPSTDPAIIVNRTTGDGQNNMDMVDQKIGKEQKNESAFFKYRPQEINISFPYLIFDNPTTTTSASKTPKSDTVTRTSTVTTTTVATTLITKTTTMDTEIDTPRVPTLTTTIPAPVAVDQINEEIILDFMTNKQLISSRSDVAIDDSTPDKETTTQVSSTSKIGESTIIWPTTMKETTPTTTTTTNALPNTTTRILTSLKPSTKTETTETPELAEVIMASSTAQPLTTAKTTTTILNTPETTGIPTTTDNYYSHTETPVYDYVTGPYDWFFNETDNTTYLYYDEFMNMTTHQTTEVVLESTTSPTTERPVTPTMKTTQTTPILVSSGFLSSNKPTTAMMDFRSTKQTTLKPSTQTTEPVYTSTLISTEQATTTTTQPPEQTSLREDKTTTPVVVTTTSPTVTSTQKPPVTTATPASTTTEGLKICQETYCKIGQECTENNTWLCPTDVAGTNCHCTQGCRVGNMFIPLGESYHLDECGSVCSCFNLYGKAECHRLRCTNRTVADPVKKQTNYTGISIGGVIYIPVQRVQIPKNKSNTPGDDEYTYGISIGGVIYIPKRNHTNSELDKNNDWTSGISLGGVIYVPSREYTNEQNGKTDYENVVEGNSSWTKGITIGGIIYVPVHKRKKTFQEKNREFEKIYDKTNFADADVIPVKTPYGTTRGITIGGVIYIPNKNNNEPVHFLGESEIQRKEEKNQTSPIEVEYPVGWTNGISIGGIIYVPVRQRKKVVHNPTYQIPDIQTKNYTKNDFPYLTKTAGIHIGGIINVPIAKRSSIKSIKIKKMNPAFG
ncbi:mucin-2-like [Saccostrea echinata]|uniref:mucin-2-like n=1 Tax=Saccostrea echinata TaxID=191078 RepID=UPI002A83D192|nr:mucin-2-like [Saccostrea echinata]